MARSLAALVFVVALCAAPCARADWLQRGVAVVCDDQAQRFALLPVVDTEDPASTIAPPAGARRLPEGRDQVIECALGNTRVRAEVDVSPPQERGQGQGTGGVFVHGLWIDAWHVLDHVHDFNWNASNARHLTEFVVEARPGGPVATLCYSDGFDWSNPYANKRCTPAGFAGTWRADMRTPDARARNLECGVMHIELRQSGEALEGTYDYGTPGCGRMDDEGLVRGIASGEDAVVLLRGGRTGSVTVARFTLADTTLTYVLRDPIVKGEPDGEDVLPTAATLTRTSFP